jgi:hypothetical protein
MWKDSSVASSLQHPRGFTHRRTTENHMAKAIHSIVALAFVFAPNLYSQGPRVRSLNDTCSPARKC